VKIL
jgi:hypothetical protein